METITPNKRIKLEEKKITFEQQNILEIKNELNRTSSFNQEMEDNAGTILQQQTVDKREIKLERLLYREYLRKIYIIYNYQQDYISIKRSTDYTYQKWRAQKFTGTGN